MKISSKERKRLKGHAHSIKPLIIIGKEGVSENKINTINDMIENNNEIKLKISQSEFIFAVYSIESISSASIEPKFLYKFIDFSDLEEMEKNSIDPSL